MYCSGQTLVHKTKGFLARLATKDDGAFAWNIGNKTGFILESGKKIVANINDFTNIEDEWGQPYSEPVKKRQFVDISAKKYLVSPQKKTAMRQVVLKQVKKDALVFSKKLIETLINPQKPNADFDTKGNGNRYQFAVDGFYSSEWNRFSLSQWKSSPRSIQFFSPKLSHYFHYIKFLINYLVENGWKVKVIEERLLCNNRPSIAAFIAEKGDKTIYWNRNIDSHIDLVSTYQL